MYRSSHPSSRRSAPNPSWMACRYGLFRWGFDTHCSLLIASIRVAVAEDEDDGFGDDLQVEEEGPVLDVVEVVAGALLDARVAAEAVHLRPAGESRLLAVAAGVARDGLRELIDEVGPLRARADDANLAQEDVDELRELVQREAAHEGTHFRPARVVRLREDRSGFLLRVLPHRAELDAPEGPPVPSDALLH